MKHIAIVTMLLGLLLPGMTLAERPVYGGGWSEFKDLLIPDAKLNEGFRPTIDFPLFDVMSQATEKMQDYHNNPAARPLTGGYCNGPTDAFGRNLRHKDGLVINRELADYYCK